MHEQMLSFHTIGFFSLQMFVLKKSLIISKGFFIFATWQKMVVFTINMTFEQK